MNGSSLVRIKALSRVVMGAFDDEVISTGALCKEVFGDAEHL